jgi:hypothetical protein
MQPNDLHNFDTLNHNIDVVNGAVGQGFWDVVFAHPFTYLGYIFAFVAAIAFLTFLRGFLSGLPSVFTMDWHEGHQEHYRVYCTWGVMALVYLFIVWELVRWIVGGVTGFFV